MLKRMLAVLLAVLTLVGSCALGEYDYDDNLTVVAMFGDEGDFVYTVETALFEKGYLKEVCVDGYFDEYTELAVKNFQYDKGYEADGAITKIQFYWLSRKYYNEWFDRSYIVYITPNGTRYHTFNCTVLVNSHVIMPVSMNKADDLGYLPCRRCNPTLGY